MRMADPTFRTFLDIAKNKYNQVMPPSTNGGMYVVQLQDFSYSQEAGEHPDLKKGLKSLDKLIDADTLQSQN